MTTLHFIARKVFAAGLICLLLAFLFGFGRVALNAGGVGTSSLSSVILGIVAVIGFFLFLACAAVIWIEAFVVTFKQWKQRSIATNIGRLIFLVVGHFFAAYVLHALLRNREVKGNLTSMQ